MSLFGEHSVHSGTEIAEGVHHAADNGGGGYGVAVADTHVVNAAHLVLVVVELHGTVVGSKTGVLSIDAQQIHAVSLLHNLAELGVLRVSVEVLPEHWTLVSVEGVNGNGVVTGDDEEATQG